MCAITAIFESQIYWRLIVCIASPFHMDLRNMNGGLWNIAVMVDTTAKYGGHQKYRMADISPRERGRSIEHMSFVCRCSKSIK